MDLLFGAASPILQSVQETVKKRLGVDVSSFYTIALLATLTRYSYVLFDNLSRLLHFCSIREVTVDDQCELFRQVLDWVKEAAYGKEFANLKSYTDWPRDDQEELNVRLDTGGWINFNSWAVSQKMINKLSPGNYWIRRGNRFFRIDRIVLKEAGNNSFEDPPRECLCVKTLGFSTEPILEFLEFCSRREWDMKASQTSIEGGKVQGEFTLWRNIAYRDIRSMDTVVLDKIIKDKVLADMNEFFLPSTARWYSKRGIPHRRGYLFHGRPGTGKTSLAYALAGFFGMSISCISLSDPDLSDSDLALLFESLPKRSIILFEDIDAFGLEKRGLENAKKGKTNQDDGKGKKSNESKITLSGLLNCLDGVAAADGRILIMTTNHKDELDAALIRPGRVDLEVEFQLSDRASLVEMFEHMYAPDDVETEGATTQRSSPKTEQVASDNKTQSLEKLSESSSKIQTEDELHGMALSFAEKLPEYRLSPAKVQGFLLMRKKDPQKAVEEADELAKEVKEAEAKLAKKIEEEKKAKDA